MAEAGTWYELPTKASAADYDNLAPEVKDLVRMSKKAHMVGRGHLMWMCWQPCGAGSKPQRTNSISSGTMLLMVTPRGAGILHRLFQGDPVLGTLKPGHFDIELKAWLEKGDNAQKMGACYVTPPVGNYSTHQSGCDATFCDGKWPTQLLGRAMGVQGHASGAGPPAEGKVVCVVDQKRRACLACKGWSGRQVPGLDLILGRFSSWASDFQASGETAAEQETSGGTRKTRVGHRH